ncbi:MAG TPA: M20/M25/M40 family metallo-hydrolase [Sulfolobales archaeon]|nr:M20/M25/M40 family metallo-hydrolase [Sulfolobales archaeon]
MSRDLRAMIDDSVNKKKNDLVEEVRRFLRMPSISGSGEGIEETASYLKEWLENRLGARASLLRYGGHPIVYGVLDVGAERTVIIYNMYDVQPVEPLELWEAPPFEARIVGDRIIARGAFNTKGALMSSLLGIEILARIDKLPVNLIFILDGEEELGSPSMPKLVEDKLSELKKADLAYFPFPSERIRGKPTIILGNRGIVFIELRCRVSKYDVHSSYSRGLYNPAAVLARIASHLIDPLEGPRIPWLEEKTVGPTEEDLKYLSDIEEATPLEELLELYGVQRPRLRGRDWYIAVHFKPTVNIDGFSSGYTGPGTKTITPGEAVMRLDFRLVPNIEPEDVIEGVRGLVKRLGLSDLVEIRVMDAYTWSKTDPRSPYVDIARKAYSDMGLKPYIIPIIPGSAPSYLFTRRIGIPMIATGPGHGGRAHAPNEYITIDTIPGIARYTAYLLLGVSMLGEKRS